MNKKITIILLLLGSSLHTWANGVKINNIFYILNEEEETATVTYTGSTKDEPNTYEGDISIPSTITYNGKEYRVTSIGNYAFNGCSSLTGIFIPKTVDWIYERAFSNCPKLTNMEVEKGNTKFDSRDNCNAILVNSGQYLVAGCQNTTIPSSVLWINSNAFEGCTGLKSIIIPENVKTIEKNAFLDCINLKDVYLPDNISEIDKDAFTYNDNNKAVLDVQFYTNRGSLTLLKLWNSRYSLNSIFETDTKKLISKPELRLVAITQTTATFMLLFKENDQYNYRINKNAINVSSKSYKLGFLKPQNTSSVTLYASCKNKEEWYPITSCDYTTREISPIVNGNATVSTITLTPSYKKGDAKIKSQQIIFNNQTLDVEAGESYTFKNLCPNTNYPIVYTIVVNSYTFTYNDTLTTMLPIMETQQPKVISAGNVIVSAETNFDESEKDFIGFEWRRTDWTDDFTSNKCDAYLYENTMENIISGLNSDKLWKYRPYYMAADGTYFYGEWVGIDPTNTGHYEPTIYTYAPISVKGNSVQLKGYAMRGSDNIQQQGFKYWKTSNATSSLYNSSIHIKDLILPENVQTVTANGQIMTATLNELDYNSEYCYVAFISTSNDDVFYGEIQSFHTEENVTDIDNIIFEDKKHARSQVNDYYNLQGQRVIKPQRGQIVIIRYSDGTSRKMLIR